MQGKHTSHVHDLFFGSIFYSYFKSGGSSVIKLVNSNEISVYIYIYVCDPGAQMQS